jgi:predicted  nucleic acid-binding Zn-ribbon protein
MDDSNAPATKGDIQQLRTEMNHQYNDLVERISDSETKLLQAFYTYAESNQKRVASIEMESAGLKSRLSTIEDRLTGVEKRLNMPPQQ